VNRSFVLRPPHFHQSSQRHSRSVVHRFSFCADGYALNGLAIEPKYFSVTLTRLLRYYANCLRLYVDVEAYVKQRYQTISHEMQLDALLSPFLLLSLSLSLLPVLPSIVSFWQPSQKFWTHQVKVLPVCNRNPLLNFNLQRVCAL